MKKRVMVVDDNELIARATVRVLKREFEVDMFLTGPEALEALLSSSDDHYHCIVCDVNMAPLSGPDLLNKIRESRPSMAEHFLFHTASINETEIRALTAPYVPKPSNPSRLLSAVSSLCA